MQARYLATGFEPIQRQRQLDQLSTQLQTEFNRNAEIVENFGIKLNSDLGAPVSDA